MAATMIRLFAITHLYWQKRNRKHFYKPFIGVKILRREYLLRLSKKVRIYYFHLPPKISITHYNL